MRATRHASRWLAVVGVLALGAGLWTPANANPPPGNNGTIKVNNEVFDTDPANEDPNNQPHVGCVFAIDFYNYEASVDEVTMDFRIQPPNGPFEPLLTQYGTLDGDDASGAGEAGIDGQFVVDLSDELAEYEPQPNQGYHVKLEITATDGTPQGSVVKHKTFWVRPCEGPGLGDLVVRKVVTGSGTPPASTAFGFRLSWVGSTELVDFTLTGGQSRSFTDLADGTQLTLVETSAHGAAVTYRVNGSPVSPPVPITISDEALVEVVVTNAYSFVPFTVVEPTTTTTSTTTTSTTLPPPTGVLPAEVTQTTPTTAAPSTTAEVRGVQLARTGGVSSMLVLVGSLLVLQGAALEVASRRLHR